MFQYDTYYRVDDQGQGYWIGEVLLEDFPIFERTYYCTDPKVVLIHIKTDFAARLHRLLED